MAERNGDGKGGGGVQINLELYGKRLKLLNNKWKEHRKEMWGGADAIAVVTPPASEDLRYLKSTALHIWLLGYEFPETVMVFMAGALHFVCSSKKAGHLEELQKSSKMLTGVDIHIHVKERKQDGSAQMNAVLEAAKASSKGKAPAIGVLAREATEGPLMEKWAECLQGSGAATVDVSNGFSEIFAVKDEVGQECNTLGLECSGVAGSRYPMWSGADGVGGCGSESGVEGSAELDAGAPMFSIVARVG
jgi:nucleosome binding factor SPN SPT16 subunit